MVMRESIELMRLSHEEHFVVPSTRSSLRGIDQDITMAPAHTNTEPEGRGRATTVVLQDEELRFITHYWEQQLDDYKELVSSWRATQPRWQRMDVDERERSFRSWQPPFQLTQRQRYMHTHSINATAVTYLRCHLAGTQFKVQRVSSSDPTRLPHSIIAAPWEDDSAGSPVMRACYGVIQNIILHQPWPDADPALDLPDASWLLHVRWYPPIRNRRPHEYGLPIVAYDSRSSWNHDPITPLDKIAPTNILFTRAPITRFPIVGGEHVYYVLDLRHIPPTYSL